MQIEIRQATEFDIPILEPLIAASVRGLSAGFYNSAQIDSALIHIFGVDTQLIFDGTYYLAETENQIAGCGGWSRRKTLYGGDQAKLADEDSLLDPQTEAARIRAFFIHPGYARRGIGKQILTACEAAATAAGFRVAELVATLPGEPLYAACGYEVSERFAIDLPEGVQLPVARMCKRLA